MLCFSVTDNSDNNSPKRTRNHRRKKYPADPTDGYDDGGRDDDDGAPKNPFDTDLSQSLYFDDGIRSIDFVLVWQKNEESEPQETKRQEKRGIFLDNLVNEGLELELATKDDMNFVKIHAPLEVLRRYSEILKLRMPMKEVRI